MKTFRDSIYVVGGLAIATIAAALILHYCYSGDEVAFWIDVLLAIFGGAILCLITSIIGYRNERRSVLEQFSSFSQKILVKIRPYDVDWDIEQKARFFDDLRSVDLWDYGACYANIWFFAKWKKKRDDIYCQIYNPINQFCERVKCEHKELHSENQDKVEAAIQRLEELFCVSCRNPFRISGPYLYETTMKALNTWYYDMMYPGESTSRISMRNTRSNLRNGRMLLCIIMFIMMIALASLVSVLIGS